MKNINELLNQKIEIKGDDEFIVYRKKIISLTDTFIELNLNVLKNWKSITDKHYSKEINTNIRIAYNNIETYEPLFKLYAHGKADCIDLPFNTISLPYCSLYYILLIFKNPVSVKIDYSYRVTPHENRSETTNVKEIKIYFINQMDAEWFKHQIEEYL